MLSITSERTHFVILAGKKYREHLIPRLRAEGQQKAWLKKRVR